MMTPATSIGKADVTDRSDRPRQSQAAVIVPAGTPGPDGLVRPYDVREDAYDLLFGPRPDPAAVAAATRDYERLRAAQTRRERLARLARPATMADLLRFRRRVAERLDAIEDAVVALESGVVA